MQLLLASGSDVCMCSLFEPDFAITPANGDLSIPVDLASHNLVYTLIHDRVERVGGHRITKAGKLSRSSPTNVPDDRGSALHPANFSHALAGP